MSLTDARESFREALELFVEDEDPGSIADAHDEAIDETFPASDPPANGDYNGPGAPRGAEPARVNAATAMAERSPSHVHVTAQDGAEFELDHGHVVIAAITSCTNTSNPSVMLGAGVLARNAVQRGLDVQPWVKTSLAPGSKVVTEYLDRAGLTEYLEALGFNLVGYGCTTCIGNSGPLSPEISAAVEEGDLAVVSVLSGNRNFEGRINQDVKMNYLASPPLCVAYALAGTMDIDLYADPLGAGSDGQPVYLRDLWPSEQEVHELIEEAVQSDMFRKSYGEVFDGDERWHSLEVPTGDRFAWSDASTYVRDPPYFVDMDREPRAIERRRGRARAGRARRQRHDRPHLARRRDQEGLARRPLPRRAWRGAQGLQLLRLAPRQPRGDDARHVRQHPAAQPARAGDRGRRDDPPRQR